MNKKISLKLFDYLSLSFALIILLSSIMLNFSGTGKENSLVVQTRDADFIYDLNEDRQLILEGPLGETVIEIQDNKVRVIKSSCPEQICVNSGWIAHQGQWVGCLPNQVFLSIEGKVDNEIDAYSF